MTWLPLAFCCVAFVELFIRMGLLRRVQALRVVLDKVAATIRSPQISDHWKERVLPSYAWQIFRLSLTLFVLLLVSFTPFVIVAMISERFGELVVSTYGIMGSTLLALAYVFLRRRLV